MARIPSKSGLDTLKVRREPRLVNNEPVLLWQQGSYDCGSSLSSSWKLGFICLTKNNIYFLQGKRCVLEIDSQQIREITILKRSWVLGKVIDQLFIRIVDAIQRTKKYYFGVDKPERWKEAIEGVIDG